MGVSAVALHERLTITVPRTATYSLLGDPGTVPAECWFVCHGYAQLAHRFLRRFEGLEGSDRWIVAPEGLSRFYVHGSHGVVGASWMTREDRGAEIEDYLGYLDALHANLLSDVGATPRIVVLGFSQGCATASRWAARGVVRPARIVLWGEIQAHDLTDEDYLRLREQGTEVLFVVGREDPYVSTTAVERAAKELGGRGLTVETVSFDGGHDIDGPTLMRIALAGNDD
jgi:predicted esterase